MPPIVYESFLSLSPMLLLVLVFWLDLGPLLGPPTRLDARTLAITLLALIVLYPLILIVVSSFSDPNQVSMGNVWLWPKGLNVEGYRRVFLDPDIMLGYRNTLFYTVAGTLVNLLVTLPAAYALSRRDLVGRNALMFFMAFTMYFFGGMIPTFLLVKSLNLLNTWWVLIVSEAVSVYNLIIARTFFANGTGALGISSDSSPLGMGPAAFGFRRRTLRTGRTGALGTSSDSSMRTI